MDKRDFQANGGRPVLIVDDDGPTLELYARALQPLFRVSTSSNWQDATAILFTQEIQIVVIEPSVAGYGAWELLEGLIRSRGLLVVICSVWDDRRYGLEAGALAYLVKPVLPSILLETLQSILR